MRLEFHPEAESEFIEAADHYGRHVRGLGGRFEAEIRGATDLAPLVCIYLILRLRTDLGGIETLQTQPQAHELEVVPHPEDKETGFILRALV